MSLLDQQMAERRERILENARAIIGLRGYERLTMRDLARASRVTVPTIYNLVGSKEQVLFAAVEQTTGSFVEGLARAPGDVIAVVDATVAELLRMPRYYRALLPVLLNRDAAAPARRHAGRALAAQLDSALEELREAGELEPWVDTRVLRERLHAHLDMTSFEWAKGGLSAAAYRATARFEAAALLLGVTRGARRSGLERLAQQSQSEARARSEGREGDARAREARG